MPKIKLPDTVNWLEGIRDKDENTIRLLFHFFKPKMVSFLVIKGTTKEEAEDIFMDVLEAIFRKCQTDSSEFIERDKFEHYIKRACLYQWLNKCRRKKVERELQADDISFYDNETTLEEELVQVERAALFRKCLNMLGEQCQYILVRFIIQQESLKQIADALGFSYEYTKKRKYHCNKKLIDLVKNHPEYPELKK